MITELDTDEELSQTSNLTQEDELTFDLNADPTVNNTQTQPTSETPNNTTQSEHKIHTRRNKRPSFSQHTTAEISKSSAKKTTQPTTSQHQSKK